MRGGWVGEALREPGTGKDKGKYRGSSLRSG
jgi:hypothetical protein